MNKQELLRENNRLKLRIKELEVDYELLLKKFEVYESTIKKMPEDCKTGSYCDACVYSKYMHVRELVRPGFVPDYTMRLYCDYGNTCKHFIAQGPKETEK